MRKKGKIRAIRSRRSEAMGILIPLLLLILFNLVTGIVNVLPSQARKDVEWDQGMAAPQVIWEHWEWGLPLNQKKSYLSVTSHMLCFSNVRLHGLHSLVGDGWTGSGWKSSEPLVLTQQPGYPAQCGIYQLQDGDRTIVYLVGRIADYRIEKTVFTLRWGFQEETVELSERDMIRTEQGHFFVLRLDSSTHVTGSDIVNGEVLTGVHMTVLDAEGVPLIWTDEKGYQTTSYYVEDVVTEGRPY